MGKNSKINIIEEFEKWDITDKDIRGNLVKEYDNEFEPYKEEHYKVLRKAILKKLDTYTNKCEKIAYLNTQKARFSFMKSFDIGALFTNIVGVFTGILAYVRGFDKIVAACMIILFSIGELLIFYMKECTPKYGFYLLLLEDIKDNYKNW